MKITQVFEADGESLIIRPYEQGSEPANQTMFKAEKGELWWYSSKELWLGLGKTPKLPGIIKTFRSLFFKRKDRWPEEIVLDARVRDAAWIENAVNGILLGGYNLQLYKTEPKAISSFFERGTLSVLTEADTNFSSSIDIAHKLSLVQMRIMDLMNSPGNYKTPEILGEWAETSGKVNGYNVKVLHKADLETLGMHALLAVSQGSSVPPVMIVSEYKPETYTKTVALVGKGVTFDTGGVSIKPSANMHLMKSDIGGAAAVLRCDRVIVRKNHRGDRYRRRGAPDPGRRPALRGNTIPARRSNRHGDSDG
jgi:leucyl aminopeptidase